MTVEYELVEFEESADEFHHREIADPPRPQIWWNHVTAPALVLGSTQRDPALADADACAAAGVDVVRRRSGGGAVLLVPDEVTWLDVIVPTGSPGWAADVHASMVWLGEHLAAVIAEVLSAAPSHAEVDVSVNRSGMVVTDWSSLICFDGLGPGEVLVGGAKLIGISQRRTRSAARFQCSWYHRHDPAQLVGLLAEHLRPDVAALGPVATFDRDLSAAVPERLRARLSGEADTYLGSNGEEMGLNG